MGSSPIATPSRGRLRDFLRLPPLRRRVGLGLFVFALSFVPMVGTLGYFSALVLGPIMALMGILAGVDALRASQASPARDPGASAAVRVWTAAAPDLAWLAGIPLALLTVGMAYNRNCDPVGGAAFYLVGPVASLLIGFTAGSWGGALAARRVRQIGLGLLPMFASIAIGLALLYTQPTVYAYDAWIGWFSGPIYDEVVSVRQTYLWFRFYNALWVATAWFAFDACMGEDLRWRGLPANGRWRLVLGGLCLVGASWIAVHPTRWGFLTTRQSTAQTLPAVAHTEHFDIHYRPGSATAREIEWVAAEHEFAWHRLSEKLGRAPDGKITSYVFPNPNMKRAVFGAGRVEVSLPWKREIYLRQLAFPHTILHHELAHSFGATIGDRVFGLSAGFRPLPTLNMGLVEGFAVAMAPRSQHGLDVHDQAAVLDRLGKRPRLGPIMGLGFFGKPSGRAYTAAGSFVAWLLETRGPDPLAKLYRSAGDFEDAYGEDLESLERAWVAFLRGRDVSDDDVAKMEARFKQPVIFRRPCAHKTAVVLGEAADASRSGDEAKAVALLEQICELEPEQPNHRIVLAATLARHGDLTGAAQAFDEAAKLPKVPETTLTNIATQRGDVALVAGDPEGARAAYERAGEHARGDGQQRALAIKLAATRDPGAIPIIIDYFRPFMPADESDADGMVRLYAATQLRDRRGWWAVGNYLLARQLLNVGRPDLARVPLEQALGFAGPAPEGEPLLDDAELVEAAKIALVNARLRTADYNGARAILDDLGRDPSLRSGDRLDLELWRERVDFYEQYVGP